jgi:2-amino-4-hydroxy-6-hydroxymethyldihydropteridine diphosphokinase
MAQVFIALGSNLKKPILQVQHAFSALGSLPNTQLINTSSLYETAPIGYRDDEICNIPSFINAVAELSSALSPLDLLNAILSIENDAGRIRPYPNAPRVLDCDLLMYDDVVMATDKLTLPHPRMHLRGFVLLPLFEIAPALLIPNHGKIATLITNNISEGVVKLSLSNHTQAS